MTWSAKRTVTSQELVELLSKVRGAKSDVELVDVLYELRTLYHISLDSLDAPDGGIPADILKSLAEEVAKRLHFYDAATETEGAPPQSREAESKIATVARGARMVGAFSSLLPSWFVEEFGANLLDDLLDVADEYGSKIWWIVLTTQLLRIVFKFTLKRFHRRQARDRASTPKKFIETARCP